MYSFIYENKNGTETCFTLRDSEEVSNERAEAERELHSRESVIVGYRVEHGPCQKGDTPGQSHIK